MARAFAGEPTAGDDVVVHAAGVSNSQCADPREFERESDALRRTLREAREARHLVYFSTCSVLDPAAAATPYARHKLSMEERVRSHPGHLILRLPQVAGRTPNPHTLLNYLYARISRGERFAVWQDARRNVIDVEDVRALGLALIEAGTRGATLNVAAPHSHAMPEIVQVMERVIGGHAVFDVIERGADYPIDVGPVQHLYAACGITFGPGYLERVVRKYYAPA